MKRSTVVANLVLGIDGSYSPSRELTVAADRVRFHEIREGAGVILIGGKTARQEPYSHINQPLLILTREPISLFDSSLVENENIRFLINQDEISLAEIVIRESERMWRQFQGDKYLLVEGGPHLIGELKSASLLDTLFLTRSPKRASGNRLEAEGLEKLLSGSTLIDQYFVEDPAGNGEVAFETYEYWRGEGI